MPRPVEEVFRSTCDPADAHGGAYARAREAALSAMEAGYRIVAVIGPAGSGKTLLLRDLSQRLAEAGIPELHLPRGDLVQEQAPEAPGGARCVMLVDEADRLDPEGLALLSRRGIVVVAGLPELGERLRKMAARVPLGPMQPDEVAGFVEDRLRRAGHDPGRIGPDAISALMDRTGGSPRLLTVLAGQALFLAGLDGAPRVTAAHVAQAADMRGLAELAAPAFTDAAPPGGFFAPEGVAPVRAAVAPRRRMAVAAAPSRRSPRMPRAAVPLPRAAAFVLLAGLALGGTVLAMAGRRAPGPAPARQVAGAQEGASSIPLPPVPSPPPPAASPRTSPAIPSEGRQAAAAMPRPASASATPERDAPTRVVIHYTAARPPSEQAAAELARVLRARGFPVAELRGVPMRIRRPSIRYFFAEDRSATEALEREVEPFTGESRVVPMLGYMPKPRPGTLEVWIPTG